MKGFTLLEVLVALGISALLTAGIYTAYTGNLEAIEAVRDQEVVYQTARVVLDRMAEDMEAAVLEIHPSGSADGRLGFIGEAGEIEGRPAARVSFTAFSHLALEEGAPGTDLCEVEYGLEEDSGTGDVLLYRRDGMVPDGDLTEGGVRELLSKDVSALEILYAAGDGEEQEEWDTTSGDQKGRLPAWILIRLTVRGLSGEESLFMTRVRPELAGRGGTD